MGQSCRRCLCPTSAPTGEVPTTDEQIICINPNATFDSFTKEQILAFVKNTRFQSINIGDNFAEKCANIELENTQIIPMILELYQKLLEQFGSYKPPFNRKAKFFLKPTFSMEELSEHLSKQESKEISTSFDSSLLHMPSLIKTMENDLITIKEFDEAFGNKIGKKDIIGVNKLVLKSLSPYLKRRIITALNRLLFNPDIAARTPSVVRASYLYKAAKQGPLNEIGSFRPIISINNIINHFHRILSVRISDYMINNGILDINIQKGGIKGIKSAIVEQVFKIKSVLKDANYSERPAVLVYLDISNAFGNINLNTLFKIMALYDIDEKIINYLREFYANLTYYVSIGNKTSTEFKWTDGLVQGCALSPILFVTALNYVLAHLDHTYKSTHGYTFDNGTNILFTAFVDDICLICNSIDHAQEVLDHLCELFGQVGLPLNKDKCAYQMVHQSVTDLTLTPRHLDLTEFDLVDNFKYLGEYVSVDGTSTYSYNNLLRWTIGRLKYLNKKKYSAQKKGEIFTQYIFPHIQKKLALMYDLNTAQRFKILFTVKSYAFKWISDLSEMPLFVDITPVLDKSYDEVINSLPDDLFDTELESTVDLTNHIFRCDSFRLKYEDTDDQELDVEMEQLDELTESNV